MSSIQPYSETSAYSAVWKARESRRTITPGSGFLDLAARIGGNAADVPAGSGSSEIKNGAEASNTDAYMAHLKSKYGRVTIESIGEDQASLEKAGRRMSGHDVVIAPNMLEDMSNDPAAAIYYEQKIDTFFNATPRLKAHFAAQGLTYETCGVVIHEDGSITYICGGGDSPERVAEVNRINREKAKKKAAQQRQYQERAAAAAAARSAMWEHTAETAALEKSFANIGDLRRARLASASVIPPEISLPSGTALFFLGL